MLWGKNQKRHIYRWRFLEVGMFITQLWRLARVSERHWEKEEEEGEEGLLLEVALNPFKKRQSSPCCDHTHTNTHHTARHLLLTPSLAALLNNSHLKADTLRWVAKVWATLTAWRRGASFSCDSFFPLLVTAR